MFASDSVIVCFTTQKDAAERVRKNLALRIADYAFLKILEDSGFEKYTWGLQGRCGRNIFATLEALI